MSNLIPQLKSGLTLFCACVEYMRGQEVVVKKRYTETSDLATARAFFIRTSPPGAKVIVAPVIGFHAQDDHGELLKA